MASVAFVSGGTTFFGLDYIEDALSDLGHTMTRFLDTAVTGSNLSAFDLIINYAITGVSEATLAGFYNDYMSVDSIPILFHADFNVLTDDNFITKSDFVQNIIGVNAVSYRSRFVGGVDPQGYGILVPETQALNHELSMTPGAHEHIVGQGFLQPNFQGTFEGESFVWGNPPDGGTLGEIATAQPKDGQVAGRTIVRIQRTFWGDFREVVGTVIEAGDARVGRGVGTFPVNCAWYGIGANGHTSGNAVQLFQSLVRWCLGDYAGITTYSTTAKSSAFRYPSAALDTINGTTYGTSSIDWAETTPANTSVTVQAALDGETFTTVANGGEIPGLTAGDPLAGKRLHLRVELATTDGISTPQFNGLSVTLDSQQKALTATPADYFQEGHLLWTKGGNNGLSIEVKSYVDASRLLTLFLKMRSTVKVGDEFTILPGCDKKIETCNVKFANSINFQGEPNVPGEDQVAHVPDAI